MPGREAEVLYARESIKKSPRVREGSLFHGSGCWTRTSDPLINRLLPAMSPGLGRHGARGIVLKLDAVASITYQPSLRIAANPCQARAIGPHSFKERLPRHDPF